MADGHIVLRTEVDSSGLKNDAKKLASEFEAATKAVEVQARKVEDLHKKLAALQSGEAQGTSTAVEKAKKESDSLIATLSELEKKYEELSRARNAIADKPLQGTQADLTRMSFSGQAQKVGENYYTPEAAAQLQKLEAELRAVGAELDAAQAKANAAGKKITEATGTATQAEIRKTSAEIEKATAEYGRLQVKASKAGVAIKKSMDESKVSTSAVGRELAKLGDRLASTVKSALLFSVLYKGLAMFKTTIASVLMSNESFRQSLYSLQAALWTAFAPILQVIVPALKTLVDWITTAIIAIGKLIAAFTGQSYEAMTKQGKALQQQAAGYNAGTKAAGKNSKATKKNTAELKKQLAAFDELQVLKQDDEKSKSGGTQDANAQGVGTAFGGLEAGGTGAGFDITQISADLATIMAAVGTSLAAVGLILLFLGNIPLGLGFIVAGAAAFSVGIQAFSENQYSDGISEDLESIMTAVASALVALGLILLVLGQIGWGLGAIIAGIGVFSVKEFAVGQSYNGNDVRQMLNNILNIASLYLAVIGLIVMMIPNMFLLGVGMVVAGIGIFKATKANLSSDKATSALEKFMKDNEEKIVGVGTALIVIGILLCACGQFLLGMGILIGGAGLVYTAATVNDKDAMQAIEDFLKDNSALIIGVGAALLVIGILILMLAGAAFFPLGLACVLAGGYLLAKEVMLNYDAIKKAITEFLDNNKALLIGVGAALLVIGVVLCVTGVGIPLGIACIVAGGSLLAAEAVLNWDKIKKKISSWVDTVKTWISEHPAALMVIGLILVLTGVGIPLGLGLLAVGGVVLGKELVENWDFIKDKIKEVWEDVKKYWDDNIAPVFTAKWWGDLAKKAMNGLLTVIENALNWIVNEVNKLSWDVPEWIPIIGGKKWGFDFKHVSVPRLAQGAVIPPNKQFLAVLGDQKQGTNVEAPLSTIEQAVQNVLDRRGDTFSGDITIPLMLDETEFGRAVITASQLEQYRRSGARVSTKIGAV